MDIQCSTCTWFNYFLKLRHLMRHVRMCECACACTLNTCNSIIPRIQFNHTKCAPPSLSPLWPDTSMCRNFSRNSHQNISRSLSSHFHRFCTSLFSLTIIIQVPLSPSLLSLSSFPPSPYLPLPVCIFIYDWIVTMASAYRNR